MIRTPLTEGLTYQHNRVGWPQAAANFDRLCQSEKHGKRPLNLQHHIVIEPADGWAEFQVSHRLRAIDRNLRGKPQTIPVARSDIDPGYGCIHQSACQRQDNDG